MAVKPNGPPISKKDIEEFLKKASDFQFEMSVLKRLEELGYKCDHAGTYQDPITEKIRSYDFRARRTVSDRHYLLLAVECKNIRPTSPLLIYSTPRTRAEAFHSLIRRSSMQGIDFPSVIESSAIPPAYPEGKPVGRSTDQVSRTATGFSTNDSQTFEKTLQALTSARDLVTVAATESGSKVRYYAVVPVLVVPDGLLWEIAYDDSGAMQGEPKQVPNTTLVYRHEWGVQTPMSLLKYVVSHLEIITYGELGGRLAYLAEKMFSGRYSD